MFTRLRTPSQSLIPGWKRLNQYDIITAVNIGFRCILLASGRHTLPHTFLNRSISRLTVSVLDNKGSWLGDQSIMQHFSQRDASGSTSFALTVAESTSAYRKNMLLGGNRKTLFLPLTLAQFTPTGDFRWVDRTYLVCICELIGCHYKYNFIYTIVYMVWYKFCFTTHMHLFCWMLASNGQCAIIIAYYSVPSSLAADTVFHTRSCCRFQVCYYLNDLFFKL